MLQPGLHFLAFHGETKEMIIIKEMMQILALGVLIFPGCGLGVSQWQDVQRKNLMMNYAMHPASGYNSFAYMKDIR